MLPFVALITVALIGIVTVGLIVWDIYVAINKVPNSLDTISGRMRDWGKQAIILPFLWAMLFGHFWGPIRPGDIVEPKTGIALLVFTGWGVLLAGMVLRNYGINVNNSWILFLLILNFGALAGACLWPQ